MKLSGEFAQRESEAFLYQTPNHSYTPRHLVRRKGVALEALLKMRKRGAAGRAPHKSRLNLPAQSSFEATQASATAKPALTTIGTHRNQAAPAYPPTNRL
jgi:hypothetical protein